MNNTFAIALASLILVVGEVSAAECPASRQGDVTGEVKTVNINQELQYGVIRLQITRNGSPYFDEEGVIIGETTSNTYGLPSTLNHSASFGRGNRLQTTDDTVVSIVPLGISNCEFAVTEKITKAKGTGKLGRLSKDQHDITATGTVGFCPNDNRNSFVLKGTVCFKD